MALPNVDSDVGSWRIERAFGEIARRCGGLAAVEVDGRTVTYAELDHRSDVLAARLARRGIGSGDVVGLACEDVSQFAVGALGILKTGAAYLSLDLRFSLQRAPAAVFEGAVRLIIGAKRRLHEAPGKVPYMGDAFQAAEDGADERTAPVQRRAPSDLAYLCYTSGTTGVAKGALIPHAGVRGLVRHPDYTAPEPGARLASCSTFAFDAITFEVWGALLSGGCVVQVPLATVRSPAQLADFLKDARIDCAFLTTSLFNAVATHRPEGFGTVTTLIVGGEAVQPSYIKMVLESGAPPRKLLNAYGPTETTTFATCHVITPGDVARGAIPIGRALEGRELYVRSADGEAVGPGRDGELFIGGEAVALGYLNAPELTADKFVAQESGPGTRMYRTGDLCRVLDDGALQYLGRLDEQVKIKGYRIEPTGVAALLRQLDGVEEAVVVPREAAFGAKQLVGFLRGDARLSEAELHKAAAGLMPDYMLPGAFSWVDEFPLKANGKLDVPTLLAKLDAQRGAACEAQASDEFERRLVEIWRRNGGRALFDLDTPFEEVCDSLAMVGVMIDIEAAFDRPLPDSALVPPVTIRSMATALRAPEANQTEPVRAFYVGPPWLMNPLPRAIGAALNDTGEWLEIRVHPTAHGTSAFDSVEAMGAVLEAQVLAASRGGPYTLAGFSLGGVLAFEVARRLEQRGEHVERVVLLDSFVVRERTPLDWAQVRLRLFLASALEDPQASLRRLARRVRVAVGKEKPNRADQIRDRCLQATFRYVPGRIAAPAVLIRSTLYESAADRPENNLFDATQAWEAHVGRLDVAEFECTHMQLVSDPDWTTRVAEHLRADAGPEAPSSSAASAVSATSR